MHNFRIRLAGAVALGAAAFAVPAGSAQALPVAPQTQPLALHAVFSGAHAACARGHVKDDRGVMKYKACKRGGVIRLTGTLHDTAHNKRCIRARIRFTPSGPVSWYKDCGGKPTRFDTGWQRATNGHMTLH
jgi:hypothetical protein